MTHLPVTPEGTTAPTKRGFDNPDFQRCDGCDSGLIVKEPDWQWLCPFYSHTNAARPKLCPRCGGTGEVSLFSWGMRMIFGCPECRAGS